MLLRFEDQSPRLADDVFVAPGAVVIGDVVAGAGTSFWYNVVVRGDVCPIRFGDRVNVQDLTMVHVTSDEAPCVVGDDVTIGHQAVLHGCTVERGCLIGMGAIVLDHAVIGAESLVAAGAVVTPRTVIPPRSLVLGSPARVKRTLRDDEVANLYTSARHYVTLAARHRAAVTGLVD